MIKLQLRPSRWLHTAYLESKLSRLVYVCDKTNFDKGIMVVSNRPAYYLKCVNTYLKESRRANEYYTKQGRKTVFSMETSTSGLINVSMRRFIIDNRHRDLIAFAIGTCNADEAREGKKEAAAFVKTLLENNSFEQHTSLGQYLRG